jgi:hypothetical protein
VRHTGGVPDAAPSPLRARLEDVSRPLLVRLTRMPRQAVPLATVVLFAVAILAPAPVAVVALAVIAVFLLWLTFLAWPAVGVGGKLMRVVMLGLVVVLGLTRF